MRFQFDGDKSREVKREQGISLREAQDIFDQAFLVDQKNDDPQQFRAIGWCRGLVYSVTFEIRHDPEGEFYHLITAWRATIAEEQIYAQII
jgi:uncharacterized DUF497 family protein